MEFLSNIVDRLLGVSTFALIAAVAVLLFLVMFEGKDGRSLMRIALGGVKGFFSGLWDMVKGRLGMVLVFALAASLLMACGQGGSWSGTAHPPVPDTVRSIPVQGPYSAAILINGITASVEPGYRMDEIRLTVTTLYAGGGFQTVFGVGADCATPYQFPPLLFSAGETASITDRATLDALLPLLTGQAFYVCTDIANQVDADLELRIKGSIAAEVQ